MSFLDRIGLGPKARIYIVMRGQVEEGAYHLFAERTARSANAKGWMKVVRRPMDSYIEMEAEGSKASLEKLVKALHKGTPLLRFQRWRPNGETLKGPF